MTADKTIIFLATWALVSLVFIAISGIFGSQIVLGSNFSSNYIIAVVLSFLFTLTGLLTPKYLKITDPRLKDERLSIIVMAILFSPFLWVVKKFASLTGLGISNNLFVLILAHCVSLAVYFGFKYGSVYLKKIQ